MYDLLSGLTVVEVSSFVASPTAGLYLAQMGAEVIRIDQIGGGLDYHRYMVTEEGRSLAWENLNRAKRSVALDLRSVEGREIAVQLAARAGQLITNLPVDSFLQHERVARERPDLVSVWIMGWHDGRQAMDFTVNAATGYPLMTGPADWDPADAPPVNSVLPAWDFITGAYGAFTMLAGLRHRDATGQGSELRVPLGDVAIGTVANSGAMAEMLYRGANRERLGNSIWGAFGRDFTTRDGKLVMVAALTAKQWAAAVEGFGVGSEVMALERELEVSFAASDHNRFTHRDRLFAIFAAAARQLDYADLAERLARTGATFERYRTMHEAARDPALVADNPLFTVTRDNPSGFSYPAARSFANLPAREAGAPRRAPFLGEHSEEVLSALLGMSSGQISRLIDAGVVAPSDAHRQGPAAA
jgi:2-methylfumaryl-CoA isomerase